MDDFRPRSALFNTESFGKSSIIYEGQTVLYQERNLGTKIRQKILYQRREGGGGRGRKRGKWRARNERVKVGGEEWKGGGDEGEFKKRRPRAGKIKDKNRKWRRREDKE